jgi:hypothetical protein
VLFRRGFVRADLDIYPNGPVFIELYGQVERVGKWEGALSRDRSEKHFISTSIKPEKLYRRFG